MDLIPPRAASSIALESRHDRCGEASDDPHFRVEGLFLVLALGLVGIIVYESRHPAPIVNLGPFRDRNFVACGIVAYVAFAILYASMTLTRSHAPRGNAVFDAPRRP